MSQEIIIKPNKTPLLPRVILLLPVNSNLKLRHHRLNGNWLLKGYLVINPLSFSIEPSYVYWLHVTFFEIVAHPRHVSKTV
jgi:hypothetical protein